MRHAKPRRVVDTAATLAQRARLEKDAPIEVLANSGILRPEPDGGL